MAKAAVKSKKPNLFQVSGAGIHITYSSSSIVGEPQFHYHDASQNKLFTGKEIKTSETELGTLVSVVLNNIPDLGSTTFTLLIPSVNLSMGDTVHITTLGITTLHKSSIIGPPHGQTDFYTAHTLTGTAAFVFT